MIKYPLVVPKSRTTAVGGSSIRRDTFEQDVTKQSLADVRNFAKQILEDETKKQDKAGNPPQRVLIDNDPLKRLEELKFKGEVIFGDKIQRLLLKAIEIELSKMILRVFGLKDSGALANVERNWQWTLVRDDKATRVTASTDIGFLGADDYLVLAAKLDYAGVAFSRTADTGNGVLRATTSKLRRSTLFKGTYYVRGFFAAEGSPNRLATEKWVTPFWGGTPCIAVGIKKRKSKSYNRQRRS